jgi:hypothetical protein
VNPYAVFSCFSRFLKNGSWSRQWRGGNAERIYKTGEELIGRCDRRQLDDLLIDKRALQDCIESIIDLERGAMKAVGEAETQLFPFGERAVFKIARGVNLLRARAFLLRRSRVGAGSIVAVLQDRDPGGHQFLVPARQGAVTHQRLQETRDSQRQVRSASDRFEHVGNDAALGEQLVV